MRTQNTVTTPDGINWYLEQEGSGPDIVLIPDGFGESKMYDVPMSLIAAQGFRVTTFDMPGLSRSANAPPETYQNVTAQKYARYILTLLEQLGIQVATFFGCSAGGTTAVALAIDYPNRVRNIMTHETALSLPDSMKPLIGADDDFIVEGLSEFVRINLVESPESWDTLGEEAQERLKKNFPRFAKGFLPSLVESAPIGDLEALKQRPISWTIGASSPSALFLDSIILGVKTGAYAGTLPGRHFPYLSHPEPFANYVVERTRLYI